MSAQTPTVALDDGRNLTPDEVVGQLVDAGPEGSRTPITEAQAEVLVYRDLLGFSRSETEDALGIGVYTVDEHLGRGRKNAQAVGAVARVLLALGLLDADEDLGLERETATQATLDDAAESENVEKAGSADATPTPWGRIMALGAVTEVTRSRDGTAATVQVDDPTEDDRDAIFAALEDLGLRVFGTENYGNSGRVKLRARAPSTDAPESAEDDAQAETDESDESAEGARAVVGLADDLAALDLPGDDEVLDERRAAVRACYDHLHAAGEASRKSFLNAVYPDHEVGYGSGASWWSSFMSDALEALAARRDDLNPPENARAGDKWTPGDEEGSA